MPVFKNNLVDDLAAQNASPSEELLAGAIELFKDHDPTATMTLHNKPPIQNFLKLKQYLCQNLNNLLNTVIYMDLVEYVDWLRKS